MNTNRQAFRSRCNQLVIVPVSTTILKNLNDEINEVMLSLPHSKGSVSSKSEISECFNVFDIEREQCHVVFVHRVDYRPGFQSNIGKVVKFSKSCYAPSRANMLRLATPSYYRDEQNLPAGIRDRYDSTLRKDASPWMRNRYLNNSVEAKVTFSSSSEPWIYCTSHILSTRESRDIASKFEVEYGYGASTQLKDVDAFAMWLGVDFALQIDKIKHLKLGIVEKWAYDTSSYSTDLWQQKEVNNIDTFVHVYHGPVHYEDQSGFVTTTEDMVDSHGSVRAWFTKRTEFSDQSEYRFVIITLGTPRNEIHEIQVSEELRRLTLAM